MGTRAGETCKFFRAVKEELHTKVAKAEVTRPKFPVRATCEPYRAKVKEYFGELADIALFVADKESKGCTANISDKANSNGTWDYCIFQINNEPSVRDNLDKCVRRAYEKYKARGNWSAWYAVCTPERVPKYEGIKCN